MFSTWEWVAILAVALLLFGTRIPAVMRSLGQGIGAFKLGMRSDVEPGKQAAVGTRSMEGK